MRVDVALLLAVPIAIKPNENGDTPTISIFAAESETTLDINEITSA
jgi:hypothetical protein